jgi:hypothetical protein
VDLTGKGGHINGEEEDEMEWEDGDVRNVTYAGDGSGSDADGFEWDVGKGDVDESSLRAMPVGMRKNIIEAVHKDFRKRSRDSYLSVAGDMDAYSEAQVTAFLRVSRFNQKVWNVAKSSTENQSEGRQIASDSSRKFFLGNETSFLNAAARWKPGDPSGLKVGSADAMSSWLDAQPGVPTITKLSSFSEALSASAPNGNDRAAHEPKRLRKAFRLAACVDSDSDDDVLEIAVPGGPASDLKKTGQVLDMRPFATATEDDGGGFLLEESSEYEEGGYIDSSEAPNAGFTPVLPVATQDLGTLAPMSLDALREWAEQDGLAVALQRSLEDQVGIHTSEELQAILKIWGFELEAVDGDNNCLFSALSLQLGRIGRSKGSSESLRACIVSWMHRHGDLIIGRDLQGGASTLSQFTEGNWLDYLKGMAVHGGSWGDHCVIVSAGNNPTCEPVYFSPLSYTNLRLIFSNHFQTSSSHI